MEGGLLFNACIKYCLNIVLVCARKFVVEKFPASLFYLGYAYLLFKQTHTYNAHKIYVPKWLNKFAGSQYMDGTKCICVTRLRNDSLRAKEWQNGDKDTHQSTQTRQHLLLFWWYGELLANNSCHSTLSLRMVTELYRVMTNYTGKERRRQSSTAFAVKFSVEFNYYLYFICQNIHYNIS